jgi:hypothetical protein
LIGLEKQWRWKCNECGVIAGYQSYPYEQEDPLEKEDITNPILFIHNDAIVKAANLCKLIKQLEISQKEE